MSAGTRHARKIETKVVDHVTVRIVWHVIECSCGWSSALHTKPEDARDAYDRHRKRRKK